MEGHKEDRRIRRTKKLLKQALAQLMDEKEFKDITVKDITERADLNRGTFYLHYTDTYDILNKIENEILFLLVLPGASPALISAEHSSCCTWVNRLAELLIRDPPLRGSRLITEE